jgi:putative thioredoxin
MSASGNIIDVSEGNFDYEVLAFSQAVPVVVDFWAEWCGPCRMLGPLLERLAAEADGDFRLAKVNVDENPNLARQYGIRGIPAVKAFRDGKVVAEFTGAQPEPKVREFLRLLVPSGADLLLEKANSLLAEERWAEAEECFRKILEEEPANPAALLGLAKSLLAQGQGEASLEILKGFPSSREYASAEKLLTMAEALVRSKTSAASSDDPLEAAYNQALRLVGRGNLEAAMDGLLDILRQDKRYRDGEPRKVMLSLFELLGEEHPLTHPYRAELAQVLF